MFAGYISKGGIRGNEGGKGGYVRTRLLFLFLGRRFWLLARCSRLLVFECALRGGRIVLLVRRLGFGGFWC